MRWNARRPADRRGQTPLPRERGWGEGPRSFRKLCTCGNASAPHPQPLARANAVRSLALASPGEKGLNARRQPLPRHHVRRFIRIQIIRSRRIGQTNQPHIPEAVDHEQPVLPGARVPVGNAQQVPDQPGPEKRPDMIEIGAEVRMHAGECAAGGPLPDSLSFSALIPAHAGIQSRRHCTRSPWTPAFAGVSGGGGLGEFYPPCHPGKRAAFIRDPADVRRPPQRPAHSPR